MYALKTPSVVALPLIYGVEYIVIPLFQIASDPAVRITHHPILPNRE